jgi:hypothetical protein
MLQQLMNERLPLNRKERFFTGTVFPMIVCRDNFRYFHRFCELLPNCPPVQVDGNPEKTNIQFFTEYGFAESAHPLARERFPLAPTSRQTPDIVVYVSGPKNVLIGVEAKMFDATSPLGLEAQLRGQSVVINYMARHLEVEKPIQCALVPRGLADKLAALPYPVVTWEALHGAFREVVPGDYFLAVLRYALDHHGLLAGVLQKRGEYSETILKGVKSIGAS